MTGSIAAEGIKIKCLNKSRYSFMDWFLPIFIILAQYAIGGFSNIGTIILIIYALIKLVFGKKELYIHKYLFFFILYISAIQVVNLLRINSVSMTDINNLVMPWILLFILAISISTINLENLYKSYAVVGTIAMLIMYYQAIRLFLFDIPAVPVTILPVPLDEYHFWGYFEGLRPSSFFTEPQAYVSFMIPLLVFAIKKKKILFSTLITISILLSTSTQGVVLVALVYIYFIVVESKKLYQKVLLTIMILMAVYVFTTLPVFDTAYNKLINTKLEDNIRLTRGFDIYASFNNTDKILGIGAGKQQAYVLSNIGSFPWASSYTGNVDKISLLGYSTTVANVFISYGLIAGLLFILMFYKMYRYQDKGMRAFLMIIIAASFAQTLLFNAWFTLYYIFYLGCCDKDSNKNNYIILRVIK